MAGKVAPQLSNQMTTAVWLRIVLLCFLFLLGGPTRGLAQCVCGFQDGAYTLTTISLDGNMSDWTMLLADPDNNQCDAVAGGGDRDGNPQGGRDLVQMSVTWDSTYLYAYTARSGSTSNQTSFAYWADTDNDGLMEAGEPVVVISWQGSNRSVEVKLGQYVPSSPLGDPLVDGSTGYADGYTMPGDVTNITNLRSGIWGASDGLHMEWAVSWAELGLTGPAAIRWHVQTNNGSFKENAPDDNMGGCGACPGSNQMSALTFTNNNNISASRDTTVYLPHTITNKGTPVDRFELTSTSGGDFTPIAISYFEDKNGNGVYNAAQDTLLTDTNGNGTPDTGPLNPNKSIDILVAVSLPSRPGSALVVTDATSTQGYLCFNSIVLIKASVTDTITILPDAGGSVYSDLNHNGQMDGTESGSGLTLYVKLVPDASVVATKVAAVNGATGAYKIPQIAPGNYTLVLDNNNNLADITPTLPLGWIGTQPTSLQRTISVFETDITLQHFGLWHGSRISGVVYSDTGTGGGTPNDGIRQANETGISSVSVVAKDTAASTVYDSTHTDSVGAYDLYIPHTATAIDIDETDPAGYLSTGGSPGTTGGAYTRVNDLTSFTATQGNVYTGVMFGDVPDNVLAPDGALSGLPGTAVFYPHQFTAGSAGSVAFSLAAIASGGIVSFGEILYRDNNCNGQVDAGEPKIFGVLALASGEKVCLLLEEQIPAEAAFDTTNKIVLSAQYSFVNALPALTTSYGRTDLTTVGEPENSGLKLTKAVDKSTALPGDILVYTITFINNSNGPLTNIVVNDSTPAYTRYQAALCGAPLPSGTSGCSVTTQPAVNGTGGIQWTLAGSVDPGASGTVSYSVTVQ